MRLTDYKSNLGHDGIKTSPRLRIEDAGYDGFLPNINKILDGKNVEIWIQNSSYISRNLYPVVIRTPGIFDVLTDDKLGNKLRNLYVALMTHLPLTIDGFKATVTLETIENRIGAGGEFHEEFNKSTRERTTITKTYVEKLGKVINRFWDFMIRYGIMDPDTQSALITTLDIKPGHLDKGELFTANYYTGTMLYIEPDMINKNVVEAFLCQNVAPKSAGEITGKRDLSTGGESKEYSIEFTSITTSNESVRAGAQSILDKMTIFNRNPDSEPIGINDEELRTSLDNKYSFNEGPVPNVGSIAEGSKPENTFVGETK